MKALCAQHHWLPADIERMTLDQLAFAIEATDDFNRAQAKAIADAVARAQGGGA